MTKSLVSYLVVILFFIPFTLLIVDANVLFPFITTKALVFRTLVALGLFLACWIYLINPGTFPRKNYLFLAIVLFFLANLLSTIFSVNPYRSFWGNAERMEGLWSLFFYLSYFFLLLTLFQFASSAKKIIFISILIVTTLISLIEFREAFILNFERPSATLGNATYIGFMNLLTIFLLIYFIILERKKDSLYLDFRSLVYFSLIIINLISLIGSQTRGSILGLLLGIFAFLGFYLLFSGLSSNKKLIIFLILISFFILFYFFLNTDLSLKIPGIKRISETIKDPSSVFPRFYAWKIFFNAFLERPIYGWGPETEPIAFLKTFDPRIFNYEQSLFDRPHNKFVEVLVKSGIVGFVAWLLILVAFMYYLVIKRKQDLLQASALFGFLFAYLSQSLTLFDMQASYILFFFGLALVVEPINFYEKRDRFIRPYLIFIFGLVLIILTINVQHYYVLFKIISTSKIFLPSGLPDLERASLEFLRLSEIAGPFLTEEAIMVSNYLVVNFKNGINLSIFKNFYDVVERAYLSDQDDFRLALVYLNFRRALIDTKRQVNLNIEDDVRKTEEVFVRLINRSPNMPDNYINFANFVYSVLGDKKRAVEILEMGSEIAKVYPRYLINQAMFYLSIGDKKAAYYKLELFRNQPDLLKINYDFYNTILVHLENNDVENSKKFISAWLTIDNSTFTRENLQQIFKSYPQLNLEKLDK